MYPCDYIIRLDMCPEEYLASPALELPKPNWAIEHDFRRVTPKTDLVEARKAFLTCILVQVLERYRATIANIGGEWCPDSFPFREMAFAIVSIASGQALFAPQRQLDRNGGFDAPGLLNEWADGMPPLLEFGSMSHQPGKPPGVSPTETMCWLNSVLVSLVLVIDGDAFTKAVAWGMEEGRSNFRIVIMTLFGAAFGEVEGSHLKISDPIYFSPLRAEYSPRTRRLSPPKLVNESELNSVKHTRGSRIWLMYNKVTIQHLQSKFVGLVALVNFFEAAANCHAASNSRGRLPVELYDRILDFVDCETWKNCSLVSDEMRESCLRKYRVDDWTAVVAGPFLRQREYGGNFSFSFDFEDLRTGKIFPVVRSEHYDKRTDACWAPLIGGDQKALMLESLIYFNLAYVA